MNGLYFYKLVSPYSEDVTKECKLTVNEIDHNFVTLKDADIKEVTFDEPSLTVIVKRNNGDKLKLDLASFLSGMTTNLEVDYDKVGGVITITHNGKRAVIDGLVTEDNISVTTEVVSDGTLSGHGSKNNPLGIASVEKTGQYKPAIRLVDIVNGEFMPKPCHLKKGDRYVTHETVSDYGYLYNFEAVKKIGADLKNGWRIPTKADWDNMLNAIEPCDEFRNHDSSIANNMLGKFAGKILKSLPFWLDSEKSCVPCECTCEDETSEEEFDVDFETIKKKPNAKKISPKGIDAVGMRILPGGFHDGCELGDYFKKRGYYWTSTQINETDVYIKRFDYNKAGVVQNVESPRSYFSLRLVKDFDGTNHQQVEYINGINYNTVMLPSLNTEYGHTIWTTDNVAFSNIKYHPLEPNNGIGLSSRNVYYINEWNGFDWEKKAMSEGESIVLLKQSADEKDVEYRIIDGVLVSVTEKVYEDILKEVEEVLSDLEDKVGSGYTDASGNTISIPEVLGQPITDEEGNIIPTTDKVKDIDETLGEGFVDESGNTITVTEVVKNEIDDRIEGDQQLQEELDIEEKAREDADEILAETISAETSAREYADTILDEKINDETDRAISAETSIMGHIDTVKESVGLDENGEYIPNLEANYISGATTIADSINLLDEALKAEEEARISGDAQTQGAIEEERAERISADTLIQEDIQHVKESIGLDEDGNYIPPLSATFISDADTIANALSQLDEALSEEQEERKAKDEEITEKLITGGTHDCANGVLTLQAEKEENNITIQLTSDYGIFPYNG